MTVPERWLVLEVEAPGADETARVLLGDALMELGGRAVWEDGGRLVTHVAPPDDPSGFEAAARAHVAAAVPGAAATLVVRWQDAEAWEEVWKRGLAPRRLAGRIVVTPSWCRPAPREGDVVVEIDPGMAFGTAEHGTTRGCIRLLADRITAGERILDVGAGSGILSIVAARLGAADVLALEADGWAVAPARENVRLNGVADRVEVRRVRAGVEELRTLGPMDGVLANLQTGLLRPLLPGFVEVLRPGGWVVLSGVPEEEWPEFRAEVVAHGLRPSAEDRDTGWCSGLFVLGG